MRVRVPDCREHPEVYASSTKRLLPYVIPARVAAAREESLTRVSSTQPESGISFGFAQDTLSRGSRRLP